MNPTDPSTAQPNFDHVLRYSPHTRTTRAVLFAIAFRTDTNGDGFTMTTAELAKDSAVSRPKATRAVTQLVKDGWLARSGHDGRAPRYRFVFDPSRPVECEATVR
jgi:DNA-binding MarR family transcriptional regulator